MSVDLHKALQRCLSTALFFMLFLAVTYALGISPIESYTASPALAAPTLGSASMSHQLQAVQYPIIDNGIQIDAGMAGPMGQSSQDNGYPGPPLRGYPAPEPFERFTINPNLKSTLKAILNDIFAELAFEAGSTDGEVELQLFSLEGISDVIQDRILGLAFSMQAFDEEGNQVFRFNKPVVIVFNLGVAGSNAESGVGSMAEQGLKLFQWSTASGAWIPLATQLNPADGTLTASITQPGELALMRNGYIYVPVYGLNAGSQPQ